MRWIKIWVSEKQYVKEQASKYDISLYLDFFFLNYRLILKMLTVHNASVSLSTVGLKALDLLLTSGNMYTHIFLILTHIQKYFKPFTKYVFNFLKYSIISPQDQWFSEFFVYVFICFIYTLSLKSPTKHWP